MSKSDNLVEIKIPVAPLKIAYLSGCEKIAKAVDKHIISIRKRMAKNNPRLESVPGYLASSYLVKPIINRMGTGEGTVKLEDSLRGTDLFIISDITNSNETYSIFGRTNHISPDNHFQDIKRLISATNGNTHRVSVIMPFLYEGRQHKKTGRESLDCAVALQELRDYGVSDIITFDAHDPSVQNSIPLRTFDNFFPTYQFVSTLLKAVPDIEIDNEKLIIISPDEGAISRSIYFSNVLGVDIGLFYKRRDYSQIVNGKNPIVAHEYLGDKIEGKDAIVIDDMIASGGSMIDVCKQIKAKGAKRVFICCTFGLFTEGLGVFDKAYEEGLFNKVITTNLVYQKPELLERSYYQTADMYRYLANIVDVINKNISTDNLKGTRRKIESVLERNNLIKELR